MTLLRHSHGALFHVWASHVERNTDVKLVGHGLALDQAELADVVAMVRGVNDVGVVQLPRLHQHVVHLQEDQRGVAELRIFKWSYTRQA